MERLTKKKLGSSYPLKNDASAKVGLFTDYDGFFAFFEAVNRLGEIEDILGDDYDLAHLRELAWADKKRRRGIPLQKWIHLGEDAAAAITDLLARAEAAEARAQTAERALARMWYAYQNKDDDFPHEYEKEALSQAENILGKWEDVMQNMMKEE